MTRVIWISGASSGIGAALARSVPYEDARLIGISRRPPVAGEHLAADLSEPAAWQRVSESFAEELAGGDVEQALLLHFSGQGSPHGRASDADPQEYERAVLLNAAAGPVLGQRFIATCRVHEVPAVLVVCSSPGALRRHRGMAHYGAAKTELLHWTEVVREEEPDATVLSVIPWATDTPMLREAVSQPEQENPLSGALRGALERGDVASAEEVAGDVWAAVLAGAPVSPLHVGRLPPGGPDADPPGPPSPTAEAPIK